MIQMAATMERKKSLSKTFHGTQQTKTSENILENMAMLQE